MNRLARVLAPALLTLAAFSQTLPPGVQKKASMGGITEYDFPQRTEGSAVSRRG